MISASASRHGSMYFVAIAQLATIVFAGCSMSRVSAGDFFEGQQQHAAEAIVHGNMEQLRSATRSLDLSKPGKKQMTLLWFAILDKNFEAIRVLVKLGSNPEKEGIDGLGLAVDYALLNTDLRLLTAMLDGGMPVNLTAPGDSTLLYKAAGAFGGSIEDVKLLLARGADINARDELGETAFCAATDTGQPDIALYLLERGANINNVYSVGGVTPAWGVHFVIERQEPGPMRSAFEHLRDRMIAHGAKFPPDPPATVRAWMKTQGMRVAE